MGDTSPKKATGKSSGSGGGKYTPQAARRSSTGGDEGALVLVALSRATNMPVQYPMLTDTNYSLWAIKMKVLMKALRVWSAIDGSGEYDQAADEGAFAELSQSVPDHVMLQVADCDTAQEAWEMIRCARVGEDHVKKARGMQLKRQFERLDMADGEFIPKFARKLITLVSEIRSLGVSLADEAVVERLFRAVPDRFADIINTIEQWGDVLTMTVQEAIGHLTAFEENQRVRGQSRGESNEQLILVTRALESLMKGKKIVDGSGGFGSCTKKGGGQNSASEKGRGDHGQNNGQGSQRSIVSLISQR